MISRGVKWLLGNWDVVLAALSFWAVVTLILSGPALAQGQRCGARAAIVEVLAERFGEHAQSMGLAANNSVVEVYASEETGTWTIIVTGTNGLTCLVASGEGFARFDPALGDPT